MELIFTVITGVFSLLIATAALWLSYRNHRLQKSSANEDAFFKFKLDKYQVIIEGAILLHDHYYQSFLTVRDELESIRPSDKVLNDIADAIELKTAAYRVELYKSASFAPNEIVEKIDNLYNRLFDISEEFDVVDITIDQLNLLFDKIDPIDIEVEDLTNLMRKDLGIDHLDWRLKKRTHS